MSNTTDVELAALASDTALGIEIKHDDKLSESEGAYVQAAVLYTSVGGRRRLRVLNAAFNCCTQVADLFRACELDTYVNFVAKQGYSYSLHYYCQYTHTHPFNGPFSGTTWVSRYNKGKTNLDFTEAGDSEWQWRQLLLALVDCDVISTDAVFCYTGQPSECIHLNCLTYAW